MDIRITWAIPLDVLITDEFDVFYKEADSTNINNWIKANPTPLPSTTNFYDILGLKPGTVYRFGVSKSCIGTGSFVDQISYYAIGCPIISVYQGPPVIQGLRLNSTLFYSVYYPNSTHVYGSVLNLLDFTDGNAYIYQCGTPGLNMAAPVGRTSYQTIDVCTVPQGPPTFISCNTDSLDLYPLNSSITSALGYYGLGGAASSALNFYSPICNVYGQSTDPILLEDGHEYRFFIRARIQDPTVVSLPIDLELANQGNIIGSCTDISGNSLSKFTPITASVNPNLIMSGALCYDVLTGQVNFSIKDGTNQAYLSSIGFIYTTEDSLGNTLPLVDSGSIPITTFDVTYTVYCPVEMDPLLDPTQLSFGMTVDVFLNDPSPNNICTITNANYTGQTFLQVCNNIALYITNNTSYSADVVTIGGSFYIRMGVTGINVVSAEIYISGPALIGPNLPDIFQVAPSGPTDYRIQSALVYDSGSGDKIYGARGFFPNDSGKIEVSDIATATTLEYNHPIAIRTSRLNLVDVAPPARAWNINVSDAAGVGVGGINQDIVKTAAWNTGYVYRLFYTDTTGTEIRVTNAAGAFVDSEFLSTIIGNLECARLISVDQTTGTQLIVLVDDPSTPGQCTAEIITHTGVGFWTSVASLPLLPSSNEIIKGTVTGVSAPFSVVSSTQYSITVTGSPWISNEFSRWTVEIISGAYAGTKVRLYNYCLAPTCNPPLTNISNDTNTLYIDPAASFGFDASLLVPGNQFVLLNAYAAWTSIYDVNASYTTNQLTNYNITFEDSSNPVFGNEFFIAGNGSTFVSFTTKSIGSYFSKVPDNTTITTNLTYNTPYRIYKINDGDIVFNSTNDYWYHSCGNGQVNVIDSVTGTLISTQQLLEPNGVTFATGAFQIAIDSLGEAYCIQRDSTNTDVGVTLTPITSKNIYRLDNSGVALLAINGSILWNENIAGNISVYDDGVDEYLFFTSIDTRKIYKYNISANTFISKTVPSVYKKSSAVEKIQGAVHIENEFMIIMNKLSSSPSANILYDYTFTNLFVYDFAGNTIEQVLVGADATPYAGTTINWNLGNYGETFAEFNLAKDYGLGGLSIKVNGSLPSARIFWKQWTTDNYYQSQGFTETGVAQLWGICVGESGGDLIKIWNIQSNGSLQASNRTLYTYGGTRSFTNLPVKMEYDTFYNHVVGVTFFSESLVLIDPVNFTGYHGGPSYDNYNISTNKLAIDTLASATLVYPTDFITNNQGAITVIGAKNNNIDSIYVRYTNVDITGPNNSFTSTGTLGDGSSPNPGLFYLGYSPGYSQIYIPGSNQIWLMARNRPDVCENPQCPPNALTPQDTVVGILDHDTMTIIDTINLSNQNADPTGGLGYYFLGFYIPGLDLICYLGGNGKLLLINATSRQIVYNGSIVLAANFLRTPPLLSASYYGWMVPYNNGVFLDYAINTLVNERWVYLTPQTVTYTGLTHNLLNVIWTTTSNTIITDDVFATAITGDTFGQWKIADALPLPGNDVVYWNNISGGGTITMVTNETLELTQFSMENPIVLVENITQAVLYDIADPTYLNANTLPTFNTLNSIPFFAIKADNVNLFNNDLLQITFANPIYPSCPFITTVTINF